MTALNLIFIALAAYLVVEVLYKTALAQVETLSSPSIRASLDAVKGRGEAAPEPLSYYQHITRRNLFKTPTAKAVTQAKPPKPIGELDKTSLNIRLWGTVTSDSVPSFAVIEQPKARRHQLYRAGDVIQEAVIKSILRDKVVLAVNGRDEVLEMEEFRSGRGPAGRRYISRGSNVKPRPAVRRRITLSRERIEAAMGDLGQLMTQARLRPHFRNGQPDGIVISRIRRASIFREMGMRSGDIITGIDGAPIRSTDDALRLYSDLRSASGAVVQVRRRGRPQTLEYTIK